LENERPSLDPVHGAARHQVHIKSGDRIGVGARLITVTESGSQRCSGCHSHTKTAAKKLPRRLRPEPEEVDEESAEVEEEVSDRRLPRHLQSARSRANWN